MGCQHLEEFYELFLLGVLPAEGNQRMREHLLQACPDCRTRFREAVETIYLLSLTCRPVQPHPRVKAELLHRLQRK
jgi:predicted anti-sigma-YlaC factor YlaD